MSSLPPPRLTRDLLSVHEGSASGYASERDRSEAGSEAGGDIAPGSRLNGGAHQHDPYARSSATFRGALHGLGIDPSKPNPRSRLQLQSGGGGNAAAAAAGAKSASGALGPRPSSSHADQFSHMTAWDRHKTLAADYARYYSSNPAASSLSSAASAAAPPKTDADVLRENHLFVRTSADDDAISMRDADKRMAKSYYDSLFKEFAIGDLSRYKTGAVGLRWRTEAEVLAGKGHFSCGSKHCQSTEGLTSFEVNFGYTEASVNKQALVKLRLCVDCGLKLHYKKLKEMEAVQKEAKRTAKMEQEEAVRTARKKERKRERKESKKSSKRSQDDNPKRSEKQSGEKRRRGESRSGSSSDSDDDADAVTLIASLSHKAQKSEKVASAAASARSTVAPTSDGVFAVPAPRGSSHGHAPLRRERRVDASAAPSPTAASTSALPSSLR